MSEDRDLMAALPDPPPPRPDRRALAIDAALRRFDGRQEGPHASPAPPPGVSFRAIFARPQVAAFATVVLVALLSLPLWLSDGDRFVEAGREQPAVAPESGEAPVPSPELQPRSVAADEIPGPVAPAAAPAAKPTPARLAAGDEAERTARSVASPDALNRLPTYDAATVERRAPEPQAALAPPPPPAPAVAERSDEDDNMTVVVTGARTVRQESAALANRVRIAEAAAAEPGDWNACTIDDPRQNLRYCRELGDLSAPGAAGRANAHIADGLRFAWQGDLDRAIDAFDKAIALAPDRSLAYLNRGLARWRKGDTGRALEDFDEAIANDPDGARGYYHRSRLYQARGATARASGDARRAIRLDPDYEAVLP